MQKQVVTRVGGVLAGLSVSGLAMAGPTYDVSAAVTAISDGNVAAASIGVALVGLAAVFLIWRWIKGSMF